MSNISRSTISPEQVRAALGNVDVPGNLSEFAGALTEPLRNVMRRRREVAANDLPIASDPISWYGLGRRPVCDTPQPSRFLAYAAGDYYVQDAGSLLALAATGADGDDLCGKMICDLCAAPGGKSTALVEAIGDSGFVLANELIGSRIGPLRLNLARTGSDRFAICSQDPDRLASRLGGIFDLVVVDAPCSGQAMVGRGKQNAASLSSKQIEHSAVRQNRILDAAIRLVRPGGRLVYSTCTFAAAENEMQILRLVQSKNAVSSPIDSLSEYETNAGCYRLWPHRDQCAGAFSGSLVVQRSDGPRNHRFARELAKAPDELRAWYESNHDQARLFVSDSIVVGWPIDAPGWTEDVSVAGPELAHRVGQTWKPSHAAALRRTPVARGGLTCEVDALRAKQFMRGEPIECDRTGWTVVRFQGRPLGWVKANGSIGKNHLPKSARMLGELLE